MKALLHSRIESDAGEEEHTGGWEEVWMVQLQEWGCIVHKNTEIMSFKRTLSAISDGLLPYFHTI